MLSARWILWVGLISTNFIVVNASAVDFEAELKKSKIYNAAFDESAFCEWKDNSNEPITGYRSKELVRIASISKIFTSFLAVKTWGPFYRFDTKIYMTPVKDGIYDVHIAGGQDPYFNFNKVFFLVSELNRLGITQIRNLTFDSKLRVFLAFRESLGNVWSERMVFDPSTGKDYVFQTVPTKDSLDNLKLMMTTSHWSADTLKKYKETKSLSSEKLLSIGGNPKLTTENVSVREEAPDSKTADFKTFTLSSDPLYRYLKDMNKYSINFIADQLFLISGGLPALESLMLSDVDLKSGKDYKFQTGSGLPDRRQNRKDNLASCEAVVKTLDSFAQHLNSIQVTAENAKILGRDMIKLSDILLVAGYDTDATYNPNENNSEQDGSVVCKTGTLTENPASNLAGYVSTKDGIKWFGLFLNNPWKSFRQGIITTMINEGHGPLPIDKVKPYLFADFLPFDSQSLLKEFVAPLSPLVISEKAQTPTLQGGK